MAIGGDEVGKELDGLFGNLNISGNEDKLDTMWNTVLNHGYGYSILGGNLATTTYLVCKIDGVPGTIIKRNQEGTHAEEQLVNDLEQMKLLKKKITVYINNSPCADCALILKTYLKKNKGIHLTLYVTHLYDIRRMSCEMGAKKNEGHMKFIKENEHEANYQGLRDLISLGDNRCKIEAFTEDVWRELHKVMGLTKDCQERMKKYDTKITDPMNPKKSHDRSRKEEDTYIEEDLIHLQENVDPWHGIKK